MLCGGYQTTFSFEDLLAGSRPGGRLTFLCLAKEK
jgi:hypothetical protein